MLEILLVNYFIVYQFIIEKRKSLFFLFSEILKISDLDDLNPISMKIICHLHQNHIPICKLPPSLLRSVYTIVVANSPELTIVTTFGPRDLVVVFLNLISFVAKLLSLLRTTIQAVLSPEFLIAFPSVTHVESDRFQQSHELG